MLDCTYREVIDWATNTGGDGAGFDAEVSGKALRRQVAGRCSC